MPAGAELLVQDLLDRLGALQRNNNERVCCSIVAEMLVSGVSAILFKTILRHYAKWALTCNLDADAKAITVG